MDVVCSVQGESGDQEMMAMYQYFKCAKNNVLNVLCQIQKSVHTDLSSDIKETEFLTSRAVVTH